MIPCHRCKRMIREVRFGKGITVACCDDCLTHYYGSPLEAHRKLAEELMAANFRAKRKSGPVGELPD